ncbi:MAG TPA: solute carrier family 23 protein [Opitutaceae bacterium]|jgi:NCS2 family nucleobase:cation symporter-2/xanthine permease XanP|nr:solute carrier family 23 protein [Opitutaceae bacterium]
MEEPPPSVGNASLLLYGPEEHLPLGSAVLVSLQQVAAMVVGVVTPALILSHALGFPAADTSYLVSMALLAAGLGTFLQTSRFGIVGSGLLSVAGTSFAFLAPLIAAGKEGGLPLMFGMSLACAPTLFLFVPFLNMLRGVFTPLVSGIVVLLIGLSIIPEAMPGITGPVSATAPVWAGGAIALTVIAVVLLAQSIGGSRIRLSSILWGVLSGYVVCALCGWLHSPAGTSDSWVTLPRIFPHGLAFKWKFALPFAFIYLASLLEALGDMTATSQLSGLETEGPAYSARIRGGVLSDGITCLVSGVIGSFPSTTYAQNNGVIQITGVASRHLGKWMAAILVALGLFPAVARWVTAMPPPVLGGMATLLFGLVSVSGLRLIMKNGLGHREGLIVALSLGVGLGAASQPDWVHSLPAVFQTFLESSVSAGGLTALLLNIVLPLSKSRAAPAR